MEFGGEELNTSSKINPDTLDKKIREGKTPEQFLSNYDFDENQRDVIIFRPPTLRDIQLYDVVKTKDGFYGLVIAMQTYAYASIRKSCYNFLPFSHNITKNDKINPSNELYEYNYPDADNLITKQIEIIRPINDNNAKNLEFMKTFVNSTSRINCYVVSYRVTDICEIHKNIHNSTKINS